MDQLIYLKKNQLNFKMVFLTTYFQILPDLLAFQEKNLKTGVAAMRINVPVCLHTQYTAGTLPSDDTASPEPPESILVLEDMRPFGYRAAHFKKGLTLSEAENAIRSVSVVHALSLGLKLKEKVDLNEKYPVSSVTKTSLKRAVNRNDFLSVSIPNIKSHRKLSAVSRTGTATTVQISGTHYRP